MEYEIPFKIKNITWTILEHKMPTWDILEKRNFKGLGGVTYAKTTWKLLTISFLNAPSNNKYGLKQMG